MATVTLKLKIDIPGLQQELDQAVKKILDVLGPLQKLGINIDDKEALAQLQAIQDNVKQTGAGADQTREKLSEWGNIITGINQGFQLAMQVFDQLKTSIMAGVGEKVLKEEFEGTAQDIENFRRATARTVDEGGLIKLSNQASDLGISMKDQVLLFALSERAGNRFNTDTETGFQKVMMASDGLVRGLRAIGVQVGQYNQLIKELSAAQGKEFKDMDFEEQKRIRIQAVIKAANITFDEAINKKQNDKEKWLEIGAQVDESREKFGRFLSDALVPLIEKSKSFGVAGDGVVAAITFIGSNIIPLLPLLVSLKTFQHLAGMEALFMAGAEDTAAVASKGFILTLGKWALPIAAAGVVLWSLSENLHDATEKSKDLDDQTKKTMNTLSKMGGKNAPFTIEDKTGGDPNKGFLTYYNEQGKRVSETVAMIKTRIEDLQKSLDKMVPQSKEWFKTQQDIANLQAKISYKPAKIVPEITPENVKSLEDLHKYLGEAGKDAFATKDLLDQLWAVMSDKDKAGKTTLGKAVIKDIDDANGKIQELKDKAVAQGRELVEKSQLLDAEQIKDVQKREDTKAKITYLYLTNEVNMQIKSLTDKKVLNEVEKQDLANLMIKKENIQKEYSASLVKSDQEKVTKQKKINETLKDLDIELMNAQLETGKDNLSKKLALLDMEKNKKIEVADITNQEIQKIEEIYSQKRINLIQGEVDTLASKYEQHFQALAQSLQTNLQETEQTSQAEIKLNEFQYNQQQQKLQQSLQAGEITKEEYDLQYQANYQQHQKYLQNIDKERQSFISKVGGDIQKYLLQQLEDYIIRYLATKAAEALIYSSTETGKTIAMGANAAVQTGISNTAVIESTIVTSAAMAELAAAAAPAATLVSIASFGAAAAVGAAAVLTALGVVEVTVNIDNALKTLAVTGPGLVGFEDAGYTGDGNKKDVAGVVHKREYVFESDLVDGQKDKFEMLHQMLQSGIPLSDIFLGIAQKVNPILQPHEFLKNVDLTLPSQKISAGGSASGPLLEEIKAMRTDIKELKEKGVKLELEVTQFESRTRGSDIFTSFKIEEKFQNKLTTKKNG